MNNFADLNLHVVSFDVPFPANYGGVIDVFHKIRMLASAGVKITLHCFDYGRGAQVELERICKKVHYYPRRTGVSSNFSTLPYVVVSRRHPDLLANLLKDDAPILFEGLHTCDLLSHKSLQNRYKIYRESNLEHQYYLHLAKAEHSIGRKLFFLAEAVKLRFFQHILSHANLMLTVSQEDNEYLKRHFAGQQVDFLPSFHAHDNISGKPGNGNYALYQGKLSVAENHRAAEYLIEEVFAGSGIPFVIAGMDPPERLIRLVQQHPGITIEANPDQATMEGLTANAHVHVMITFQATGLKLKLLNTLYSGRHCLVNSLMLSGTGLDSLCTIGNNAAELKKELNLLMKTPFSYEHLKLREQLLKPYDNFRKLDRIIKYLSAHIGGAAH